MHKSSPRNMLEIYATQIGHVLYSTSCQKPEYGYHIAKRFKMAINRLYIAKSRILRLNSIRMHKSSPRNMLEIYATQIGHVLYSTSCPKTGILLSHRQKV